MLICSSVFPITSYSCFKGSDLMLKSLIHFELNLVQGGRQGSSFSPLMWISSFPSNICWRDCLFSIVCFGLLCWRSVGCSYTGLCLSLLFLFIGLPVCSCFSTMLFLLLWLCSRVWSWVLWYLQHWTFSSELLWLFEVFCVSIYNLGLIFLFLWRMSLEFWKGFLWICKLLSVVWPFSLCWFYQSKSNERSFHLLMSSSISLFSGL
jgi:hypothetical protein